MILIRKSDVKIKVQIDTKDLFYFLQDSEGHKLTH